MSEMPRDRQSSVSSTSELYVSLEYRRTLRGSMAVDRMVLMAVIVTDSARSALKILYHIM